MKITLQANVLHAAALCAPKKDIRYYLVGVNLTINHAETAMVCGTTGHILFAGQAHYESDSDAIGTNIIIPLDIVKRTRKTGEVVLERQGENWILDNQIFTPVDRLFPDASRVIPTIDTETPQIAAHYNPDYVVTANESLRTYYCGKKGATYPIIQRGDDSGVMHGGTPAAIVVIMPIRSSVKAPYAHFERQYMVPK